jgi:hypothetical protein
LTRFSSLVFSALAGCALIVALPSGHGAPARTLAPTPTYHVHEHSHGGSTHSHGHTHVIEFESVTNDDGADRPIAFGTPTDDHHLVGASRRHHSPSQKTVQASPRLTDVRSARPPVTPSAIIDSVAAAYVQRRWIPPPRAGPIAHINILRTVVLLT